MVRSRYVSGVTTSVLVFFALVIASGFANSSGSLSLAFVSVMEILLAALIVRAWRSATAIIGGQAVVVRALLRTRTWPRSEVQKFVAETRSVGMGGWRRRVLGIRFVDGTTRWLTEINARPGERGAPNWIDEAVSALNGTEGA